MINPFTKSEFVCQEETYPVSANQKRPPVAAKQECPRQEAV